MKILFFIHSLGGGGAERIATILLNHLCEKNEVYVAVTSFNRTPYPLDNRVKVIDNSVKCKIKGAHRILKYGKIHKAIKTVNPDIIISFIVETNGYVLLTNLLTKKKIIVSERNSTKHNNSIWKRISRKYLYPKADKVVFVAEEECQNSKLANKTFIYNPCHLEPFSDYSHRDNSVIAVGSLHKWHQKGFDLLIDAWAKIEKEHPEWQLEILGRTPKSPIPDKIHKLGLEDRVTLLGPTDDVASTLRKKSIYILSSRYEGFPNGLLEAMSQGCACIATNCHTGPKEIITVNKSGILAEVENIEDMSIKISDLIEKQELRKKLSTGAIEEAKRFDIKHIMRQWDDLIESIVNHNS